MTIGKPAHKTANKATKLTSYQLVVYFAGGTEDVYNFPPTATYNDAFTQYAALTQLGEKHGKAKLIQLIDLLTAKIVEETTY